MQPVILLILLGLGTAVGILAIIYLLVPIFKVVGWLIAGVFRSIGWVIMHVFEFVAGMLGDAVRFVGAIIAMIVLTPLAPLNIIIGRWSAAGHFAESVKREVKVAGVCLYRIVLQRPLKLVMLHGLLEGVEQRVPEAMGAVPPRDKPSRRSGSFDNYVIVGSLRGGGSGAKLYIAEPSEEHMARNPDLPDRVVIKSFALSEGSSLPQIVRESRALEAAKQLGLVLEHRMDEHRFYYVMPFHAGENLGIITRQFHGQSDGSGLDSGLVAKCMNYTRDLLATLSAYHRGGLWHKDVKPENVIVHDGRAHVVDLGLVTSLGSAMTLTTHGTEYFRDPEMVRMALKGVKVHQVDGAKFDIYAAGAVLYFMLENTFPAHGGLSRFNKRSPESLRWVVRRAMTDYDKRYETADEMLADVEFVSSASDAYAVKPAELPSMRGGQVPEIETAPPHVDYVAAAGSPPPPREEAARGDVDVRAWGVKIDSKGVKVGRLHDAGDQRPAETARRGRRPRLRVTNWWTGAYDVVDDASDGGDDAPFREQSREFRRQARDMRQQAGAVGRRVRAGTVSARRAAREQLKAARSRAQEMQQRARSRRPARAAGEKQPSGMLVFLTVAVVSAFALIFLAANRTSRSHMTIHAGGATATAPSATFTMPSMHGDAPSVVVVSNHPRADHPEVQARMAKIIEKYHQDGYNVVLSEPDITDEFVDLLEWWNNDQKGPADELLEDLLEAQGLYGVVYVTPKSDYGAGAKGVARQFVFSTRPDASSRRLSAPVVAVAPPAHLNVPAPLDDRPLLLINDHPASANPDVQARIDQLVADWSSSGWVIVIDEEMNAEADLRTILPRWKADPDGAGRLLLDHALVEHGLGGVLRIVLAPGEGAPESRIGTDVILLNTQNLEYAESHDAPGD